MIHSSNCLRRLLFTILFTIVVPNLLLSQPNQARVISGIVLDKETGEPISSVNVYISQTTIGTYTEDDGTFRFTTELSGVHTLVFSYVGFMTDAREINLRNNQEFGFRVELEPESLELSPLEVTASNKEWQEDFELFKRNFIGSTGAAMNTEIENPWVISFEKDENGNLLAQAESPLSIKNYTIGYAMQVDLIEFRWPVNGEPGYYLFYANYREMEPLSEKEKQSWERNRRSIYLGSFEHFLKCLYENTLDESEFEIVVPNTNDKVSIPEIENETAARLGLYSNLPGLRPEEVKVYRIRFPLEVFYGKRKWYNTNRLQSRIVPMGIGGIFLVTNRARLANPLSFRLDGAWSMNRIANLLPVNYQP